MLKNLLSLLLLFISFNGYSQSFNSIWNTSNTSLGSSALNQITIPTNPAYTNYDYTVDWGDGTTDTNVTGNITHTYAAPGLYTIAIGGTFPAIYFNGTGDRNKIREILSWGDIVWQTMESAFSGCSNLNFDAIDAPDLSQVTSLRDMFRACTTFNGILNHWEVDTVTDMSGLFRDAIIFNRPLESWNTINVTDLSFTFSNARAFNEPLDNWNTASVTTLESTFSAANAFNQNINGWDVGLVTTMRQTFLNTNNFDMPLNNWIVSNVTDMSAMFASSRFNRPIGNWNVGNVTTMSNMFREGHYNQPLALWNVSQVTDMSAMFQRNRTFNQPLNSWNVSNVTNMASVFDGYYWDQVYNQPLDNWDVSNVTNMSYMFRDNSAFNQDIGGWNVGSVTNMQGMFSETPLFNQNIGGWNVSNVTNMASMFQQAQVFNQPLNSWNMGNVTNISGMFYSASNFNQPLNSWDVSNVTGFQNLFNLATSFNQDITSWNTASITNMSSVFNQATSFNQNLGSWDISAVTNMTNMLSNSGISQENYDNILIGWSGQTVNSGFTLGANGLQYCDALTQRQSLLDDDAWNITGDSVNCSYVLCTQITMPHASDTATPANSDIRWAPAPNATGYRVSIRRENGGTTQVIYDNEDVGNVVGVNFTNEFTPGDTVFVTVVPYNDEGPATGCPEVSFTVVESWVNSPAAFKLTYDTSIQFPSHTTPINQLRIQTRSGLSYNYNIDWGDGQYNNNVTGELVHTYLSPGVYTVSIIGDFPAPRHEEFNSDARKLLSIDQWGAQVWQTMQGAFAGCENMEYNATDVPNLTNVTDMSRMFIVCRNFNGNINDWDVGNVTNMSALFGVASVFDQPLDNWDVGNVTNMALLFFRTDTFNQDISGWDTGNVTNMPRMFEDADAFNQSLEIWDVSSVTNMESMFKRALIFNGSLNNWNTENVTNMREMFDGTPAFNQPIGNWNVSSVTDMSSMFRGATAFNQNINPWSVASVANMSSMFNSATAFNQPLNNWNVGSVNNMSSMFSGATNFDQPLNNWNVASVNNMSSMFSSATNFDQNINSWNVGNVINMNSMFHSALAYDQPMQDWTVASVVNMSSMFRRAERFNRPLNTWNVSAVANMTSMFENALAFDQPLGQWNVSSVTLMESMFEGATLYNQPMMNWNVGVVTDFEAMFKNATAFNQPLNAWNTGEALTMEEMFNGATAFNQSINSWNTSFVTTMEGMFEDALAFNQSLNGWNVASVTTMERMFKDAAGFNGEIDAWNVRGVDTMREMFSGATTFNQSLNNWRVSNVMNMDFMFNGATAYNQPMNLWNLGNISMRSAFFNANSLNQYLGDWNISGVTDMRDMLDNTALIRENYDNTIIAWSEQTPVSGITLGAQGLPYCDAQEERLAMIAAFGWTFDQDVRDCPIPECTQLASPLNGDTDVPINTNLTWNAALFAQGYRLTVGTSPGGTNIVNNLTITNETSYEFTAQFNTNDMVYVTIVPFNDEGDAVGPCIEERFTISSDPATIPECTLLTEPLNNANDVLVTTDLSWNPISNADGYRVSVGTTTGGNDLLDDEDVGNVTTYDFTTNLPEDIDIFVTITPYNDEGDAASCTEERFHTELIPVPPACTNLTSPANGATNVPIDTNLSWNAVSNATGYLVVVGTTSGGVEVVNNVDVGSQTTYDIQTDLLENRTYFVSIIPYNDEGDAIGCSEETFRTGNSSSPPSCVLLAAPVNGSTSVAPGTNLSWNGSSSATGYRLRVGTTSGGIEIFSGDLGNVTTYDPTNDFSPGATIYVTLIAYNANGDATGCTEQSFSVDGPPACTTLISPANLQTNIAVTVPNITWNTSTDADGYRITVTGSSSSANNVTDLDVFSATTYNFLNEFERGETVTVTITPYNSSGDAVGCTSESFTIIPPPVPSCNSLIIPADMAVDVAVDTNISWTTVADATGYRLSVTGSSSTANNITDALITSGNSYDFPNNFEQGETVTVTIVPYNAVGDAIGCSSESFTIKAVPACTNLIAPANGAIDVASDTSIEWAPIADATGYRLSVTGSSSTANTISDELVTSGNSYDFPNNFEQGETVTVTIVPYNEVGDAIGCSSESFTIKPVPNCSNLIAPANLAIGVAVDTNVSWAPISEADGYKLTVVASSSTLNNLTDFDITSGTSYDFPSNFEQGETVTVTITPYNEMGDAIGCSSQSFTIESVPTCTSMISPANGAVVSQAFSMSWNEVADAYGYKITIAGTNTTINDITDFDLTSTTYVFPNSFSQGDVVSVTITPYNEVGDAMGCSSESFTIRPVPTCTNLVSPLNNATQVSVITDISWNESFDADGYRISVGTSPNGTDIVNNEDVASLTSYTFANDLPADTLIYVILVPYNTSGAAIGCTSESFETEIIAPTCTTLTSPANGEQEVALQSSISWEAIANSDGYRLSIGTTAGGTDIVANLEMGTATSYAHSGEFPFGSEIFVTITPYNSAGQALLCELQSFTTRIPEDETLYGFSPDGDGIKEYWHIDNIELYPENSVTIYNRWGDVVFQVENYNNTSNAFRGEANRATKMGARDLPSGTYFFQIDVPDNNILGKTKGFVVLKR